MPKKVGDMEELRKQSKHIDECNNRHSTLSPDTKLVIVGTITPPDTPYFYCSKYNRIYGYIDAAMGVEEGDKQSLKSLKKKISEDKEATIKEIKRILQEKYSIAFLDVMEAVTRRKKDSPYDKDIDSYVLASEKFDEIPDSATIIVNSKLAKDCLYEINESLGGIINKEKIKPLSQRCDKKVDWVNAIKHALGVS